MQNMAAACGGFPHNLFLDENIPAMFECAICTDIVRNAADTRCGNGHIFCKTCLEGAVAKARPCCPSCRQPCQVDGDGQFLLNDFVDRQVKQLRVKCAHEACSWRGLLAEQASCSCVGRVDRSLVSV